MSSDTAILQLTQAKGLGTGTLDRVLKRLSREGRAPDDLVKAPVDELVRDYGLRHEVAQAVKMTQSEAEKLSDELSQQGVTILFKGSTAYPTHLLNVLGDTAPPLLFAKGNLALLQRQAVGFTGSRKTSDKGLKLAEACASGLAEEGINIVSGYASGTDLAAHKGALATGGVTTLVLVEGILNFRMKQEIAEWCNEANFLAISEFAPKTRWIARNAMQRNRTICGLSDAMILTESGLTGGTFAAGETTLALNLPLFVIQYAQPPASAEGNASFLNRGAKALRGDRHGHPKLESVWQVLGRESDPEPLAPTPSEMPALAAVDSSSELPPQERPSIQTAQVALSLAEKALAERALAEKETEPVPSSPYPKRLIEVDLPIKRISAHARREKSIRHGHISTLHIWWARRPLAACRAVICASLWVDPVDPLCPQVFRDEAATLINQFAKKAAKDKELAGHCSPENWEKWQVLAKPGNQIDATKPEHLNILRYRLLDFIADFANWDNSTQPDYLGTSRSLTQAAHEALGGLPRTKPLVVDPFAGGGSIPLEALRVGADAFASDLNPVAVLLNKVVLEYIPKYGQRLADEVRKWGQWVKEEAEKELMEFYPKDPDGATPIAYLWARTITCEGPGCGAEVPLLRSLWLAKRANNSVALRVIPEKETRLIKFEIIQDAKIRHIGDGTIKNGAATCPCCGYTTSNEQVRAQLAMKRGGTLDARLITIVVSQTDRTKRKYRLPTEYDLEAVQKASQTLTEESISQELIPPERPSPNARGLSAVTRIGMSRFGDLFTPRQMLTLNKLASVVDAMFSTESVEDDLKKAIISCLSLVISRQVDYLTSLVVWSSSGEFAAHTFGRQALSIVWDFAEVAPFADGSGNFSGAIDWVARVCEANALIPGIANCEQASATICPLPDDSVELLFTDPPYYDAIPYADLSDFFYIWLRRTLINIQPELFQKELTPKDEEAILNPSRIYTKNGLPKDEAFYESQMQRALEEGRRVTIFNGIGVVVFAHKSTSGWEAMLSALIGSGWTVTASWSIDTERSARVSARGQARLASSVHLVCRPRENPDGSLRVNDIGDWRDVLQELPKRIHEWMPRLAAEGVVGADAIFACLGPALEIFSRYSHVEKASGANVALREYLEHVWATISKEALSTIFDGADASGFEEDARLTVIWFWVLKAANSSSSETSGSSEEQEQDDALDDDEEKPLSNKKVSGYAMEYDAVRKLAQGLGANLIKLSRPGGIIIVKGNIATLNTIATRERYLLGEQLSFFNGSTPIYSGKKGSQKPASVKLKAVEARQLELLNEGTGETLDPSKPFLPSFEPSSEVPPLMESLLDGGMTILDRLHQSMLLFGRAQTSLLGKFLHLTSMGTDERFWRLAQALSALYPPGSDEKRWVDGVLARKKGLGF